nr:ATP-binding protein [Sedimentibacter sp.]
MAVDADKIERIMLNLLSNAVKFTNDGDEITVTIKDNEDYVSVCVKDTGIGIPEDKLKMIFDRFAQIDKTLIRNKEGSGIGLSLV